MKILFSFSLFLSSPTLPLSPFLTIPPSFPLYLCLYTSITISLSSLPSPLSHPLFIFTFVSIHLSLSSPSPSPPSLPHYPPLFLFTSPPPHISLSTTSSLYPYSPLSLSLSSLSPLSHTLFLNIFLSPSLSHSTPITLSPSFYLSPTTSLLLSD